MGMTLVGKFNTYTVQRDFGNGTKFSTTVGTYWVTSALDQPLHYQWQVTENLNDAIGFLANIFKFLAIMITTCCWWCGAAVFCFASCVARMGGSQPPIPVDPGAVQVYTAPQQPQMQ